MYKVNISGFDELIDSLDKIAKEEEFLKIAEPILKDYATIVENDIKTSAPEWPHHSIHGKNLVKTSKMIKRKDTRVQPVGLHNYINSGNWKQARGIWFQNWLTKNGNNRNTNFNWFQKVVSNVRTKHGPAMERKLDSDIQKFLNSIK